MARLLERGREAVEKADAVLLAVHWLRFRDVLKLAGNLSGKVVVTCRSARFTVQTLPLSSTRSAAACAPVCRRQARMRYFILNSF